MNVGIKAANTHTQRMATATTTTTNASGAHTTHITVERNKIEMTMSEK